VYLSWALLVYETATAEERDLTWLAPFLAVEIIPENERHRRFFLEVVERLCYSGVSSGDIDEAIVCLTRAQKDKQPRAIDLIPTCHFVRYVKFGILEEGKRAMEMLAKALEESMEAKEWRVVARVFVALVPLYLWDKNEWKGDFRKCVKKMKSGLSVLLGEPNLEQEQVVIEAACRMEIL
jgi:hypothetical protein